MVGIAAGEATCETETQTINNEIVFGVVENNFEFGLSLNESTELDHLNFHVLMHLKMCFLLLLFVLCLLCFFFVLNVNASRFTECFEVLFAQMIMFSCLTNLRHLIFFTRISV